MAGDLMIQNLTYNQRTTLIEAGGTADLTIYHADKPWSDGALDSRVSSQNGTRVGLPAHSYITFKGGAGLSGDYSGDRVKQLRLDDILRKCSRPAFVSQKASLNGWPGVGALSAVNILVAALPLGSIIIEYYTFDGKAISSVFTEWSKVDE